MSPRSVQEYVTALRPHYTRATRPEKGRLLTEVCRLTGYHLKAAIRLLRHLPTPPRARRSRPRHYGPAVTATLRQVWIASDYLCAKRLAPFLAVLVPILEQHRELTLTPKIRAALLRISAATIDCSSLTAARCPGGAPTSRIPR